MTVKAYMTDYRQPWHQCVKPLTGRYQFIQHSLIPIQIVVQHTFKKLKNICSIIDVLHIHSTPLLNIATIYNITIQA